jgi:alkanesulfonate monooxygenase SsuD/methylene tetrahydromethanopterin reductase-like flavin-dependent oxidoreductase (luciferase family)
MKGAGYFPIQQGQIEMSEKPNFHFGYLLPTRGVVVQAKGAAPDTKPIFTLASTAESLGMDSVWLGDSVLAKPRLESFTTWAAILSATKRVQVGTAVLLAALRHPVMLAQSLATFDCMFPGRVLSGLGVGRPDLKIEFETLGVPLNERARRFSETVEIVKLLMQKPKASYSGKHFSLKDIVLEPRPVTPGGPPIWISSNLVDSGLRRVARFADGWITNSITVDIYRQCWERIMDYAEEATRAETVAHIPQCLYVTMNINPDGNKAEKECGDFLSKYYHKPFEEIRKQLLVIVGDGARVEDQLRAYADAGASVFVVRFAGGSQEEQLENFVSELFPRFK